MAGGDDSEPSDKTHLQHVLIKWTGGKRRQARRILDHFPRRIATYHEPFLGGGAVLYELLGSDIQVDRLECSDLCVPLIELWEVVRDDPDGLVHRYAGMWGSLKSGGKGYYNEVRHEFNTVNNPYHFFFLLRMCRNGLVRFNRDGEFNSAFHGDRPGMDPGTVEALVVEWGRRLRSRDVRFSVRDYRQVATTEGDLLYLDPPYQNEDGKYYSGMIDFPEFFGWLRGQRADYLLSLNGFLGDVDRTIEVPGDLYDEHLLLANGVGTFERLNGVAAPPVSDSLYLKVRSVIPAPESIPTPVGEPTHAPPLNEPVNRSAEIRLLLKAEPKITGPEVVRRLGKKGIQIDANLVRVVRHNLRRVKKTTEAEEESKTNAHLMSLARLALIQLRMDLPRLPQAGEVRITAEDLLALAKLIGGEVSKHQLMQAGHGLWAARYGQLTGSTASMPRPAGPPPSMVEPSGATDRDSPPVVDLYPHPVRPNMGETDMPQSFSFGEEREARPTQPNSHGPGGISDELIVDDNDLEKFERQKKMGKRRVDRRR